MITRLACKCACSEIKNYINGGLFFKGYSPLLSVMVRTSYQRGVIGDHKAEPTRYEDQTILPGRPSSPKMDTSQCGNIENQTIPARHPCRKGNISPASLKTGQYPAKNAQLYFVLDMAIPGKECKAILCLTPSF